MKFRTTILTFNPPSNSSSVVVEVVSNNEMEFSIMSQSFSSGHSKVLALLQLINMKNYDKKHPYGFITISFWLHAKLLKRNIINFYNITQTHIIHYPAYKKHRERKSLDSDEDVTEYFGKVLKLRVKTVKTF